MQYAVMEVDDGVRQLIDAAELAYLNDAKQPELGTDDEEGFTWHLVYGALMWPPPPMGKPSFEESVAYISQYLGYCFVRSAPFGPWPKVVVKDAVFFPMSDRKAAVAALLLTDDKIPSAEKFGMTLTVQFGNRDTLTNVLNRKCLLSLKGEDKRAFEVVNRAPEGWRELIDQNRAMRTAGKCR
jgi:hypothetical protein